MHRFFLDTARREDANLALAGGEAHHAAHVLRVRRGERVAVLNGLGDTFLCEVLECRRERVDLQVVERHSAPRPRYEITLLQAIPKGKIIEAIIQKATELGVARIVPLLSERVVTHLDGEDASAKAAKWQAVAIEAVKQCGAPWLPRVEIPATPKQFIDRAEKFDIQLIGSLQPNARHPRLAFEAFSRAQARQPVSVAVWIGPEGDFTPAEVAAAENSGAFPITLGPLVLRVETAAIYCLSIVNYEMQTGAAEGT